MPKTHFNVAFIPKAMMVDAFETGLPARFCFLMPSHSGKPEQWRKVFKKHSVKHTAAGTALAFSALGRNYQIP